MSLATSLKILTSDIQAAFGWQLLILLVLMVVVALAEGASMVLLLPLLSAIGLEGMGGKGPIESVVTSFTSVLGNNPSVYGVLGLVITVLVCQGILSTWQAWWIANLQRRYGASWQRRLFDAFMAARWTFFSEQKLGQLVNAITQETMRLAGALQISAQLVTTMVVAVVYVAISYALSPLMTIGLVVFGVVLFVGMRRIRGKNYRLGIALGPLNSELNVLLTEFLGGAKLIKATATEDRAISRVANLVDSLRKNHTWATFLPNLVRILFELLSLVALCILLVVGHDELEIPSAHMLLILALFVRLLPRFNAFQQNLQMLATYVPAIAYLTSLLKSARRRAEPQGHESVQDGLQDGPIYIDIRSAGYGGNTVLRDVNVALEKKGFFGVVGESGAGKSTLVNCLLGLCEIYEGDVRIGSQSIKQVPLKQWRRAIGYVPQETILFHLSIRENITWGKPDATLEEVRSAARRAHAASFIESMPHGYDTVIGDQGVRISGGQRQRIGLARALITDPRILILDEATSALDSASEQAVFRTLDELRSEVCIVAVAHRLASVRGADRVLVMANGRLVDQGSWEDLTGPDGSLVDMVKAQTLE